MYQSNQSTNQQVLPIAKDTFESMVIPVPFITISRPSYWHDDMDITLHNILSKSKRMLFGKTRIGQQSTITAVFSVEHHSRHGIATTNEHVHALVTIDSPEYSDIFSFTLWELLGMDKKKDRIDTFQTDNYPSTRNDWITNRPVTFSIGNRQINFPLKPQIYNQLDNDFQLANPSDYQVIMHYSGKSESLERRFNLEPLSYSGYWQV